MQWNKRSRRAGFILAAVVALAGGGIAAAYYTVIATGPTQRQRRSQRHLRK